MQEISSPIFVCEWSLREVLSQDEQQYEILTSYDYTYHTSLQQAQSMALLAWRGYAWAKGMIAQQHDLIEPQPFHQHIVCATIWTYQDYLTKGKHDWLGNQWQYFPYTDEWLNQWVDMLQMPAPLR